jgi:hypothetical protein
MAKPRSTVPGDVVLIHYRDQPASFARIEEIRGHERRDWFYCDLLMLALPPQPVTWVLRREQIDGSVFTMSGESVRIERLPDLGSAHRREGSAGRGNEAPSKPASPPAEAPKPLRGPKVVSLFSREGDEADRK